MFEILGMFAFVVLFIVGAAMIVAGFSKEAWPCGSAGGIIIAILLILVIFQKEAATVTHQQLVNKGLGRWVTNQTNGLSSFEWTLPSPTNLPTKSPTKNGVEVEYGS